MNIYKLQIAHAIKRYVRLGFDVTEGEDIENAVKDLCGTSISQMDPNREKNKGKIKTFVGISKLNEWQWPINGPFAGYIQARSLPNIGNFINYSPIQIEQSSTTAIKKPTPQISTPSIPQSSWSVPIISLAGILYHSFYHYIGCLLIYNFQTIENNPKCMKIGEIKELLSAKNIVFDPNSNKSTLVPLLEEQLISEMATGIIIIFENYK